MKVRKPPNRLTPNPTSVSLCTSTVWEIRAINSAEHPDEVIEEIASANVVTTAVGPTILKFVAPHIVAGLALRDPSSPPLQVMACENAINATDGAGANCHMSSLGCCALLTRAGYEAVLQVSCRDRNRIAIQGDLLGAAAMGVRNVLCLTGDDVSVGDQPEAKRVFDLDSVQMRGKSPAIYGLFYRFVDAPGRRAGE